MINKRFMARLTETKSVLLAAVLFVLAASSPVSARTPPAREWCGVIERINHQAKTLAVRSDKESKTLELIWRDNTRFIRNSKFDSPVALKQGTKVCVFYRAPIFGKPFATKVVWVDREQTALASAAAAWLNDSSRHPARTTRGRSPIAR